MNKSGELIKKLREENKWSQEELANKLFVDRSLVSKWERGKIEVEFKYMSKLSELFNIEIEELIFGEKKNKDAISDLYYKNYMSLYKLKVKFTLFKYIIIFLCLIIIFLLAYLFINNHHNQLKTETSTNSIQSENKGVLIITDDKSFLIFNEDFPEPKEIEIYYYKDDKNKVTIYKGDSTLDLYKENQLKSSINYSKLKKSDKKLYIKLGYTNTEDTLELSINSILSNEKITYYNIQKTK